MLPTQDFSARNLLWMRGRKLKASKLKSLPTSIDDWQKLTEKIEQEIAEGKFRFSGMYSTEVTGKKVISTTDVSDALVLRKINDNIRRAYGIRQAQRAESIQLAKSALAEWTPKGIITLDLQSCFESITPASVLTKLRKDGRVSSQTISLLDSFFKETKTFGSNHFGHGLPRGVLISSTLAELYLKDLDSAISLLRGIYVFIRYVDDIFIIAARPEYELQQEIEAEVVRLGLRVNKAKAKARFAGCRCGFVCSHKPKKCPCDKKCECQITDDNYDHIDYLGYRLIFPTGARTKSEAKSFAILSARKAHKTKLRIARSIAAYRSNKDFDLLNDRIRYLTRNVITDRGIKGTRLLSGVAFTFSEYSEPPKPHRFEANTLQGLDTLVRIKVRQLLDQKLITQLQYNNLLRNTFKAGFSRRHRLSLPKQRISLIRTCWNVT